MGLMPQNRGRRLEAKEWLRRAAEKGNLWAIISLARMHLADKEDEEAARWFRRGADAGDLGAHTVTLCFFYKAAVSSRTSKRPPAGTPPKLRKVTSIATCRSPSSMQAERVSPVTQFKPTRLRLSLRLFLTTATCSAFASLK